MIAAPSKALTLQGKVNISQKWNLKKKSPKNIKFTKNQCNTAAVINNTDSLPK
jgi:hypothetical protein